MLLPKTLILNNTAEAFITVRNLQPNNSNRCARGKMSLPLSEYPKGRFLLSEVRSILASQESLWKRQVTGNLREKREEEERKQDDGSLGSEEISDT